MAILTTIFSDFEDNIFQITQPHLYDGKRNNEQKARQPLLNSTLEIKMYTHDNIELKYLAKGSSYGKGLGIFLNYFLLKIQYGSIQNHVISGLT